MKCSLCGFEETKDNKTIGIFAMGSSFKGTNNNLIGLFGCPNCKTVMWTDDFKYIQERKSEYKNQLKR